MFIGPTVAAETDRIREMGFEIVDSLKILGFNIKADGTAFLITLKELLKKLQV
jgi:hypothetical protein